MKTQEFVEGYLKAIDKNKYIESHISKDTYVPYEEKISRCDNIIETTMYKKIGEKKVFCVNSPAELMLYSLTLISLYTDIDINFKNILEEFNLLDKNELIDAITSNINKHELNTWNKILSMKENDEMTNYRDISSVIENKFDAIELLINSTMVNKDETK